MLAARHDEQQDAFTNQFDLLRALYLPNFFWP
jgi:hypothetical protein